jgi:hypothetical protein
MEKIRGERRRRRGKKGRRKNSRVRAAGREASTTKEGPREHGRSPATRRRKKKKAENSTSPGPGNGQPTSPEPTPCCAIVTVARCTLYETCNGRHLALSLTSTAVFPGSMVGLGGIFIPLFDDFLRFLHPCPPGCRRESGFCHGQGETSLTNQPGLFSR